MTSRVFLDTNYAIALCSPADQYHELALDLSRQIAAARTQSVTTVPVLLEIGDALSRQWRRDAAADLIHLIVRDPRIEKVPLTQPLFEQGLELFESRPDKDWGLTDCISFVVMRERGLIEALSADVHFEQAGFVALLRG